VSSVDINRTIRAALPYITTHHFPISGSIFLVSPKIEEENNSSVWIKEEDLVDILVLSGFGLLANFEGEQLVEKAKIDMKCFLPNIQAHSNLCLQVIYLLLTTAVINIFVGDFSNWEICRKLQ
jgi:hypothetical protein